MRLHTRCLIDHNYLLLTRFNRCARAGKSPNCIQPFAYDNEPISSWSDYHQVTKKQNCPSILLNCCYILQACPKEKASLQWEARGTSDLLRIRTPGVVWKITEKNNSSPLYNAQSSLPKINEHSCHVANMPLLQMLLTCNGYFFTALVINGALAGLFCAF